MEIRALNKTVLKKQTSEQHYVNVSTNRIISDLNRKDFIYTVCNDYYICGTKKCIREFHELNLIPYEEEIVPEININIDSTDVEDVPDSVINNMCEFELNGLSGKAKIVNVKDGDTLSLLFYVKLCELTVPRMRGRKKAMKTPVLTQNYESGFFTVFNCRLYGIDAAEHNTAQGQYATLLLQDYLISLKNIVYIKVKEFDKYGRMLIEMYSDAKMTDNINNKLLKVTIGDLGKIALPYFGATKDESFKNLVKVQANFINRENHSKLLEKYKL